MVFASFMVDYGYKFFMAAEKFRGRLQLNGLMAAASG